METNVKTPKMTSFQFITKDGRMHGNTAIQDIVHTADSSILTASDGTVYIVDKYAYDTIEIEIPQGEVEMSTKEYYEHRLKMFQPNVWMEAWSQSNSTGDEVVDLAKKHAAYATRELDIHYMFNRNEVIR